MAELADAPDLGSGISDVQVQVLSSAPEKKHTIVYRTNVCFFQLNPTSLGINPLAWMKSLRDEILLHKVKRGGFNFI